jgi:3-hydroxybutyryl-CoA dehydrogenase
MLIEVICNGLQWDELMLHPANIEWKKIKTVHNVTIAASALFVLDDLIDLNIMPVNIPIFINQPFKTLASLHAAQNVFKINAWPSFLQSNHWEIMGTENEAIPAIFTAMQKQFVFVQDAIGFVSTRVISMIINEAYFAFEENISTKEAINIAMKLGTNYPYGPFEWADKLGIKNVYMLLHALSKTDNRYMPSTLLQSNALV